MFRRLVWLLKIALCLSLSLLPSGLRKLMYRWVFGFRFGRNVKLGFGVAFVGVGKCEIGNDVRIRHMTQFWNVNELIIGDHVQIGYLNLFRGGKRIELSPYVTIMRLNVFNSIPNPDIVNIADPQLFLGNGAFVSTSHWLDFTDRISIGPHSIIGGRNSSFWTHNRQRTRPITIGSHCYLGSEIRAAPGVVVGSFCIVGLGTVLAGKYLTTRSLIAGNPGQVQRELSGRDLFLTIRKTRNDIPDSESLAGVPDDLLESVDDDLLESVTSTSPGAATS
jgi:acetyltransferase-like isoleucine patch superfamily enzyme